MSSYPLEEIIKYMVLNTLTIERIANSMLKKYQLTAQSFKILNVIAGLESAPNPSAIEKILEVSMQSISQRLNHLEKNGYIQREHIEKDRRQTTIVITGKGKEVFKKAWDESKQIQDFMKDKITQEDSAALFELLKNHYQSFLSFEALIKKQ